MSIVLGFASETKAILMSDGRVLDNNTKHIITENYPKVYHINDKVAIGYTGIKELGECLTNNLFLRFQSEIDLLNMDIVASALSCIAKEIESSLEIQLPIQVLIAGIDFSGNMALSYFSKANNFEVQKYVTTKDDSCYVALNPDSLIGRDVAGEFLSDYTLPVRDRMKNCIEYVAKIDSTVNNNVFELNISL